MSLGLLGEASCLGAALCWACSVNLFRPAIRDHGAATINLVKCTLATGLLGLATIGFGQAGRIGDASPRALGLLVVSAWIGLTLGDTALFAAVARIGPYRTMLLQTLAPVVTALLDAGWRGVMPSTHQALGAALILGGVALVESPRRFLRPSPGPALDGVVAPATTRTRAAAAAASAGYGLALLAALGQGVGVVLTKEALVEVPFLPASFLRMGAAAAGLVLVSGVRRSLTGANGVIGGPHRRRVLGASLLGACLGLALGMAGIALSPAAVAAVLMATTPVFGLFIDHATLGEPITPRGVAGTLVAVGGVFLLGTR